MLLAQPWRSQGRFALRCFSRHLRGRACLVGKHQDPTSTTSYIIATMSNAQHGAGAASHSEADLAQVSFVAAALLRELTALVGVQGTPARRTDRSRPGEPPRLDREEDRGASGAGREGRARAEGHARREREACRSRRKGLTVMAPHPCLLHDVYRIHAYISYVTSRPASLLAHRIDHENRDRETQLRRASWATWASKDASMINALSAKQTC